MCMMANGKTLRHILIILKPCNNSKAPDRRLGVNYTPITNTSSTSKILIPTTKYKFQLSIPHRNISFVNRAITDILNAKK